jgi:hypothetical protein
MGVALNVFAMVFISLVSLSCRSVERSVLMLHQCPLRAARGEHQPLVARLDAR